MLYGLLSLGLGYHQGLAMTPLFLCVYLTLALSGLLYMVQAYFSFRSHEQALQHVHYAFAGQKRYLVLMGGFALLLALSLGWPTALLSVFILNLSFHYGRSQSLWSGALALAGSICIALGQIPTAAFQDPIQLLSLGVFMGLWAVIALNPGFFKLLRSA